MLYNQILVLIFTISICSFDDPDIHTNPSTSKQYYGKWNNKAKPSCYHCYLLTHASHFSQNLAGLPSHWSTECSYMPGLTPLAPEERINRVHFPDATQSSIKGFPDKLAPKRVRFGFSAVENSSVLCVERRTGCRSCSCFDFLLLLIGLFLSSLCETEFPKICQLLTFVLLLEHLPEEFFHEVAVSLRQFPLF